MMEPSASTDPASIPDARVAPLQGTQTLARGLDVLGAVADGALTVADLAARLGLARSTAHRLAASLVEHRFLTFAPRDGYALGPRLIELGQRAREQASLPRLARPVLEALAASTGDTAHLGIRDGMRALYLDKIAGRRRVEISSRVGERQPLRSTGLGKALVLDGPEAEWRRIYESGTTPTPLPLAIWLAHMRDYAARGIALDREENEDRIRCAAAPIRDEAGRIVGAISVSGAAQYMDDVRLAAIALEVRDAADAVGRALGWSGRP